MAVDTDCPLCRGLGGVIRQGASDRLFIWPCAFDCAPPIGPAFIGTRPANSKFRDRGIAPKQMGETKRQKAERKRAAHLALAANQGNNHGV